MAIVSMLYGAGGASSAEEVSYDNTTSGLEADNVQDAVDEVNDKYEYTNVSDQTTVLNPIIKTDAPFAIEKQGAIVHASLWLRAGTNYSVWEDILSGLPKPIAAQTWLITAWPSTGQPSTSFPGSYGIYLTTDGIMHVRSTSSVTGDCFVNIWYMSSET